MKFSQSRLAHQILVVFAVVVALALILSGGAVSLLAGDIVADNILQGHQQLARRIAEEIQLQVEQVRPLISQLAEMPEVRGMEPAATAGELLRYRSRFRAVRGAYVADLSGQQIARSDGQPLEEVSTTFGFQVAAQGHELTSDLYFADDGAEPVLTIYQPIREEGALVGVLVVDVSFAWVQEILQSLTLTHDETAVVLASNGRAVAHSRMEELAEPLVLSDPELVDRLVGGVAGVLESYVDGLGRTVVGVHSPVRGLGWGVVIQTPVSELRSEVMSLYSTMGIGLLGGVALAVLTGWPMAKRLARPIGRLAGATERVAEGDLDVAVEVEGSREVALLASSFNRMVAALRSSRSQIEQLYGEVKELNAGLERQIAERTQALSALDALAAVASRSLEMEALLEAALDTVLQVLGFESGAIYLRDPERGVFCLSQRCSFSEALADSLLQGFLSSEAVHRGVPVLIDDLAQPAGALVGASSEVLVKACAEASGEASEEASEEGYRSLACLPLLSKGEVQGLLVVGSCQGRRFRQQDADLFLAIGHQVGVAVQNARLYRAEQRRAEQVRLISEVGQRFSSILAVDELLTEITRLLKEVRGYYLVGIALIEADELVFRAGDGAIWDLPNFQPPRLKVGHEGITGWVAQSGEPLLVPDVSQEPRFYGLPQASEVRAEIAVPLKVQERVIGVLHAQSDQLGAFDQDDMVLLQFLAHPAAIAIENARLYERAQQELAERRRAEAALQQERDFSSAVLDTAGALVVVLDPAGRVVRFNRACERSTGYDSEEVEGQVLWDRFLLPEEVESVRDVFAQLQAGRSVEAHENYWVTAAGDRRLVSWSNTILTGPEGGVEFVIGTGIDITERRQAEEALRRVHEQLEERVWERTAELEAANRQLRREIVERERVEADLRESEEKYRVLVEHSLQGLAIAQGASPRLVFVNPALGRMLGYAPEELTALSAEAVVELVHPEDRGLFFQRFAGRLTGGTEARRHAYRFLRRDGSVCWMEVSSSRIEYEGKLAIQGAFVDVTERWLAEEELRRRNEELTALNAIASAIAQSLALDQILTGTLDKVLEVTAMEAGWIQLLDPAGSTLTLAAQQGFSPEALEWVREIDVDVEQGGASQVVRAGQPLVLAEVMGEEVLGTAGEERPIRASASVPIGVQDRVLGVLSVFSDRPGRLDEQEVQLLAAIGHQIGVAVENVRLAQEASEVELLRELSRLRSELIANVSHELRTPLGLIKIFCTSLLMDDVDFDRATERKFLRGIEEETENLEAIVDNLLDLSRMRNGRLRLDRQWTDIALLADRAMGSLEAHLAGHRFVRDLPSEPLAAVVDARQVEQVLRNLLSNAIKYSPEGGEITVRGRREGNSLVIQVQDQGIGIPPEEAERVFERFYRVENEVTRRVRGAGLGLAVCRGIVEGHGGRIWVTSRPGEGSTFSFTLPIDVEAGA